MNSAAAIAERCAEKPARLEERGGLISQQQRALSCPGKSSSTLCISNSATVPSASMLASQRYSVSQPVCGINRGDLLQVVKVSMTPALLSAAMAALAVHSAERFLTASSVVLLAVGATVAGSVWFLLIWRSRHPLWQEGLKLLQGMSPRFGAQTTQRVPRARWAKGKSKPDDTRL